MNRRTIQGSWSLIGLLVVAVLIGLVAYIVLGNYLKVAHQRVSPATGAAGGLAPVEGADEGETPIDVAKDEHCRNMLDQIRKAIQMAAAMSTDEGPPPSLQALSSQGITSDMLSCPVGKEPYQYDPRTGRVWCVHPGHQSF
jgi:hypothetical protein